MLSAFSVRKPYTIVVAVIIIAILGAVSLTGMNLELLPNIDLPVTVVTTPYIGASPEEVENTVTQPMEQSMATVTNISSISSISRENMSILILEFEETANMDSVLIEMRENLDMLSAGMPDDVGSSNIIRLNPDMLPIMVTSVSVEGMSIADATNIVEDEVMPELESIEGVASVNASGLGDFQIEVVLQEEKIAEVNEEIQEAIMEEMGGMPEGDMTPGDENFDPDETEETLGEDAEEVPEGDPALDSGGMENGEIEITKDMIAGILSGQNFGLPAGYVIEDDINYLVRVGDEIEDLEELRQLIILPSIMEGVPAYSLEDVAEISMIDSAEESYAKVNGEDAIILDIQKQTGYSTAAVADNLRAQMDEIMEDNSDISIVALMDQGEIVNMVISSISMNLIIGGLLAILILIIFLKDLKPSITIALAIPISLVSAFVAMYFSGVTLNIISMSGLALGVGMLVDNSIVVIENIYRMKNEGRSSKKAAVDGAKQVAGAITASTLTTISVFVPILFTDGIARQIFTDMGLTIAYSLLASLLVSLTLVPMISSRIMDKGGPKEYKLLEKVKKSYGKVLDASLRRKWIVIVLAVILFVGSVYGSFSLGTEFIPPMDTGELSAEVTFPEGSTFEEATARADEIMEEIYAMEEVETVGAFIGGGMFGMMGMGGGSLESLSMYVLLYENIDKTTREVAEEIRDLSDTFDSEITVDDDSMDMAMLGGDPVSIDIYGRDLDTLRETAQDVAGIVEGVEGTMDVSDGVEEGAPEFSITVDKDAALAEGLTVAQVYMEVSELLEGVSATTTLRIGIDDYDIYVYDEDSLEGADYEELEGLTLENSEGEEILITDIAGIEETLGFSSISRSNQQRYVTVSADLESGYNIGLVNDQIEEALEAYEMPEGYRFEMGGEIELIMDSFGDLFLMLGLGVIFIYLIMVAQFQSLLSPFIVMFTIPLAFTGGFLALIVTGNPVSIIAFLGLIILSGIVVNNGIVFVDYINKRREGGMEKREAIITAGQIRLRPIVMTALTTIIALSTLTIGVGQGVEMIQPMAITAVGGLIYATLLTLILIPVLYDILNRKEYRSKEVGANHGEE